MSTWRVNLALYDSYVVTGPPSRDWGILGARKYTSMRSLQRAGYGGCFGFSDKAVENPCTSVQGFGLHNEEDSIGSAQAQKRLLWVNLRAE